MISPLATLKQWGTLHFGIFEMILYELQKKKRYGLKLNSETVIISIKSKMDAVLWSRFGQSKRDGGSLSESRHRDLKCLKRGFKLLLITNNDSEVQAKHSLWVIIMVVPCVVIADCKTSSCLHLWKQAGWFVKWGGQEKSECVIQLVDSNGYKNI